MIQMFLFIIEFLR